MARPAKVSKSFRLSEQTVTMLGNFADAKQLNMTDVVEMAIWRFIQEADHRPELLRFPLFTASTLPRNTDNEISGSTTGEPSKEDQQQLDELWEELKEQGERKPIDPS